ncbi:MAG: aminotransferase class V-fold PLP-dependent enzyme [Candidatus Kapabacteria bacterium]|nr:aminotransferase class V-fold PLP-dependent enzyme [Candidatus Kapabacteria bacterium]
MYKQYFSKFLAENKEKLHFAAHSHHYWLDITREAVLDYWDNSAKYSDEKWELILGKVIPEAQKNIAEILDIDYPEQIAFAPNTHEFVFRLISCFDWFKKLKILSTDSEFHSFTRQTARLEEVGKINVNRVETFPFESFLERFLKELEKSQYDIVFLSNVFFNSGFYIKDLTEIVEKTPEETMIVIDGYHSFMAIPQSIRKHQSRIFLLGGGYKYAMSGEGVCFMFAPKNNTYRPIHTGWFATFGSLTENQTNLVAYSNDAYKFWGSTFDPTGIYRFNSVCKFLKSINLDVPKIHNYVINLQNLFLDELKKINSDVFNLSNLLTPITDSNRGHFLTFQLPNAAIFHKKLREQNVITDYRGDRLRFGFGIYQNENDIIQFSRVLSKIK